MTTSNRAATSSGSVASQAKVAPAVSSASFASLSGSREAIATCSPCFANRRASEALAPGPTPTINAVFRYISTPSGDRHDATCNIGRFRRQQPQHGGRDFVDAADTAHLHTADEAGQAVGQSGAGMQIGLDQAGTDRVHPDAARR